LALPVTCWLRRDAGSHSDANSAGGRVHSRQQCVGTLFVAHQLCGGVSICERRHDGKNERPVAKTCV